MSKWKMVKLGEVCTINMGQSPDSSSYNEVNDGIPFYQGNADFGVINPVTRYWCNKPTKIAEKNDILFSVRAPIGAINVALETCCIGRGLSAIRPNTQICNDNFIRYTLLSSRDYIIFQGTGSTFKAINKSVLSELEFPLPPLETQKKIADELDKITALIEKRKSQIEKLELLTKAKFVEMFGDPVLNPMGWEKKTVIDYCDCMVPGRDKPKSFTGNIPWITIDDLIVNRFTYKSKQNLGLTDNEIKQVKRKTVPVNSVIMSCVGNLGICSVAKKEIIINQQLHSFQCRDMMNNIFLMHYLGFQKEYMESKASSTTVLYMNKTVCNSIPALCPPIALQNKFAKYVEQIESTRYNMEKGLAQLETLYKQRMQNYFE